MLKLDLILCFLAFAFSTGRGDVTTAEPLPAWITSKAGFTKPEQVNSVELGNGSLSSSEKGDAGWVVTVNDKDGPGVELRVEKLSMDPDRNDFLLVAAHPLTGSFKRIKLYTGQFKKPLKPLRIPNTKTIFVLYSTAQDTQSPEMVLSYRRYGSPLELINPPKEDPSKKKETRYEIQLKGKPPGDYEEVNFLNQVKEAIRASAKRFCAAHNVPFNDTFETNKMVLIHRVSFCPLEWPDRDICASVEHSVFVSGVHVHEQDVILDYELVKDNLKKMWEANDFPELQEIGVTVFLLPSTSSTVIYWSLIIGLMLVSTFIITLILWKASRTRSISPRRMSAEAEVVKIRRPKMKLHKHQKIPSFMYKKRHPQLVQLENHLQKEINEQKALGTKSAKDETRAQTPIGNYVASVIFGSNKAFEDDEENVEFQNKRL